MPRRPKSSLLDQVAADEAAAPSLFLVDSQEEGTQEMEMRGEFTGERLLARRPGIYQAILQGYSEGLSIAQMCRAYRVSHHTVSAVIDREPAAIAAHKKEFIASARKFQRASLDRLNDGVYTMPLDKVAVAFGIVSDKLAMAMGEATSRIEHTETPVQAMEEYYRMISGKVIEAEVLQDTGFKGEEVPQKEADPVAAVQAEPFEVSAAGAGLALLPGVSPAAVVPTGSSDETKSPDEQSDDMKAFYSVEALPATHLDTHSTRFEAVEKAQPATQETAQGVETAGMTNDAPTTTGAIKRARRTRTEGGRGSAKSRRVSGGH